MKTYRHIALAALVLGMAACSQEDFTPQGDMKDTPITIASAGVAELTTRAGSVLVGTQENPATMSVFVTGGTSDRYKATNVKWTNEGSYWKGERTMLFEGVGSQQQIYALSPYVEGATGGPVTITADGRTDWLVTAEPQSITSYRVNLTMTHALAKLVLVPTFGTEITTQTITSVKVGGMYASGTLDIASNTWDAGEETTELTMTDKELLVIPMEGCLEFPIFITADNRTFKTTVSLAKVDNKLEAGTQYNITLQVGQDKVTLGDITAEPWATPTEDYEDFLETE